MKSTVLRFVVKSDDLRALGAGFHPGGTLVLNSTEWRGKEPRTCAVTSVKGRPYTAGTPGPITFDVEVTYKPKGYISYAGATKYDGWTALVIDRAQDGTLLDGKGAPLPEGAPPVYIAREMYGETDFHKLDFGEFVGETEVEGVKHVPFDEMIKDMEGGSFSSLSSFVAPRRSRPQVKLIVSSQPSGFMGYDGFRTKIVNINRHTPHFDQVLLDKLAELMSDFIEGRAEVKSVDYDGGTFVELSDSLVDVSPNEEGLDSWFDVLSSYTPIDFMDDLAKRLASIYAVQVTVVDGKPGENAGGLLLKREEPKRLGE